MDDNPGNSFAPAGLHNKFLMRLFESGGDLTCIPCERLNSRSFFWRILMHYYQHNIADYRKDTAHLTLLEHGIYRQLMDTYYLDEKPIETQSVIRRLSIKTEEEAKALNNVLNDFFTLSECGNFHAKKRCDEEIIKYQAKAESARVNGQKGGRPKKPRKTQSVILANPNITQPKANSLTNKPLTNKPIKNKDKSKPLAKANPDNVTAIFNYWLNVMNKPSALTKLTPKRVTAIKNRLKDGYTPEQIKAAIVGCSKDGFSMGQNDRNKAFNDIELICRTGEKLEGFIETETGLETDLSFMEGSILDIKQGKING